MPKSTRYEVRLTDAERSLLGDLGGAPWLHSELAKLATLTPMQLQAWKLTSGATLAKWLQKRLDRL